MIKAVLIDIDNTLLDFDAYVRETMREGFCAFGLGVYDDSMYDVFHRINSELWRGIEQGILTFDELQKVRWNRVFAALGISFDGVRFEKYFRDCLFDNAIPIAGATDMLHYLKGRYILGVASNGPYEQQLNRLKVGKMYDCFSQFFISEQVGASKPSEQFFSHCLSTLQLPPDEIMMIGDSLTSDMAGAIACGMKTCFFDKNKLGKTNGLAPDHIIDSLDAVKTFL